MADIKAITLPDGTSYNLRDDSALHESDAIPLATIQAMWNGTYVPPSSNETPETVETVGD